MRRPNRCILASFVLSREALVEGARILHPISVSSTPAEQLFCSAASSFRRSPFPVRRRGALLEGRESYNQSPIRQPLRSNFFCSAATFPLPLRSTPRRPSREGPRILQPIGGSSSPSRELFRRRSPSPRLRRRGARARTRVCRSAAAIRSRRQTPARDPRSRRRRCAPRAH